MPAGSERDAVAVAAAAAAKRRAAVPYELLRAHGLQPPSLLADVVPQQPPLPTPPPAAERPSPRLVKNAAGRWELQRAPGDDEPPPEPLQRPGAELAAAVRKRKHQAELEARLAAPSSQFDLARAAGCATTERDAEAAARARIKERHLVEFAKARASRSTHR